MLHLQARSTEGFPLRNRVLCSYYCLSYKKQPTQSISSPDRPVTPSVPRLALPRPSFTHDGVIHHHVSETSLVATLLVLISACFWVSVTPRPDPLAWWTAATGSLVTDFMFTAHVRKRIWAGRTCQIRIIIIIITRAGHRDMDREFISSIKELSGGGKVSPRTRKQPWRRISLFTGFQTDSECSHSPCTAMVTIRLRGTVISQRITTGCVRRFTCAPLHTCRATLHWCALKPPPGWGRGSRLTGQLMKLQITKLRPFQTPLNVKGFVFCLRVSLIPNILPSAGGGGGGYSKEFHKGLKPGIFTQPRPLTWSSYGCINPRTWLNGYRLHSISLRR